MEQYLKEGVLTELSTAFSRDAPDKKVPLSLYVYIIYVYMCHY